MFNFSKSNNIDFAKLLKNGKKIINGIPLVKKNRERRQLFKFIKYSGWVIIAISAVAVVAAAVVFFNLKQAFTDALGGKSNLEMAVALIKEQNFKDAGACAQTASESFNSAILKFKPVSDNAIAGNIFFLKSQISDIEYLLSSAEILSRAAKEASDFGQSLKDLSGGGKNINFTKLSKEEKKKMLGRVYQSTPELTGMKANLDLALLNLKNVKCSGLLRPLKNKVDNLKIQLNQGINILSEAVPISRIFPLLAGYPEKASYLVLLQNSDELRPTGGFLGTYGVLEVEYGEILKLDTHDIYHIDMPVKDKINIQPPEPLKQYLGIGKWYMRDANWSPDWPAAARNIEWFYKNETKLLPEKDRAEIYWGDFQGVIAVNPEFIIDLLAIAGPVEIEGETYNKDNFMDLLQYKVEKGYVQAGVSSWHRKEVIGEIAKELKIKLFDLPPSRWHEAINAVSGNVARKNILLYAADADLQQLIKEQGWAGEIKETNGDYFMVVDANMASLKTDEDINRSISYKVDQGVNGMFAELTVNYAHKGSYDWKTTRYRTYTRVYVPSGSRLIKAEISPAGGSGTSGEAPVITENDAGKTSFGVFIEIEPGKIGSLTLEYKLPDGISENAKGGYYELYAQKQPGNNASDLIVDLKFLDGVKSYNPTGFFVDQIGDNRVKWESDLEIDKRFIVNF